MRFWTCAVGALLAALAMPAGACESPPAAVYRGGTIITMDGDTPQLVEAVAIRGDKIAYVGDEANARHAAGNEVVIHDLRGATMLPGFVDAHSHFALAMQSAGGLDLTDPALPQVTDVASLKAAVGNYIDRNAIPAGQWVIAWQYDQDKLADRRHITRADLDAIAPGHKVILFHVSLHGLVANSAALAAAEIDESTPIPPGGIMPRDTEGRLTGLLFESAAYLLLVPKLPKPDAEQRLVALGLAQDQYFREGYTHAQDGATSAADLAFFTGEAARHKLKIDLTLLPIYSEINALLADPDVEFGRYRGHVKLQGIKFVLDGSPQARTAFFTRDYAGGSPSGAHPWHGEPGISEPQFAAMAKKVHDRGWQIFAHANGDAAIDMAIHTFDGLGIKASDDRRPVVIHSQFMRRDQIPAYVRIGVGPAYFSNHTYYWADTHRENFGADVVNFISPMHSSRTAGLHISNHNDFPVTALNTRFQLWTSMARESKSGVVSGANERLDAYAALQALTTGPAWQIYEENRKGRIKPGLLADFVILDKNPLATPIDAIKDIKVLETIKEGQSAWTAETE